MPLCPGVDSMMVAKDAAASVEVSCGDVVGAMSPSVTFLTDVSSSSSESCVVFESAGSAGAGRTSVRQVDAGSSGRALPVTWNGVTHTPGSDASISDTDGLVCVERVCLSPSTQDGTTPPISCTGVSSNTLPGLRVPTRVPRPFMRGSRVALEDCIGTVCVAQSRARSCAAANGGVRMQTECNEHPVLPASYAARL